MTQEARRAGENRNERDAITDSPQRMVVVMNDPMWGPLSINPALLLNDLSIAQGALGRATTAAQYRTDEGGRIGSRWADLLGGVSQVIDSLITELQERWPDA